MAAFGNSSPVSVKSEGDDLDVTLRLVGSAVVRRLEHLGYTTRPLPALTEP